MGNFVDIWNQSNGVENRKLPDGDYVVKILSIDTKETKNSGLPMLVWKTEIKSGPTMGYLFVNRVMDENKPFTIDKAKQDFIALGLRPQASEMQATIGQLIGKEIKVNLTTDGDYQNAEILGMEVPF